MGVVAPAPAPSSVGHRDGGRRRWGWPQYLALVAVPILTVEAWTIASWAVAGPHQITQYRHGHTRDWWGARGFEAFMVLVSLWVVSKLVRDCRERRRLLTFDVMFCICCASLVWASAGNNFFEPMFSISSNFVNLNDFCGHNPLVVNPDCGRFANPILFLGLLETFGLLGCAMLLGGVVERVRARWPTLSTPQLVGIVCVAGCVLVLGEPALLVPLHLWTFPGTTWSLTLGGTGFRYPVFPEILVFGLWIGLVASIRIFRDDQGLSFVERGLSGYGGRTRTVVTLLALYATVQIATWGPATAPMWVMGFNQHQWAPLPPQLQNGLCDSGRVTGTRYGPCPGSPGFKLPVALPGSSP
ncbi:MAG: spirocyclase AveC family protein [Solirubrobacteraceae bacterium]